MKNFKSNKDSKNKVQLKKEQANTNIIAFRLDDRFFMPILDKVADVANLSRTCAAQAIVREFLVEYNKKTIKASEKAKELNLPEPSPLEPFINSHDFTLQCGILFRKTKASKLIEELTQGKKAAESEVVSND